MRLTSLLFALVFPRCQLMSDHVIYLENFDWRMLRQVAGKCSGLLREGSIDFSRHYFSRLHDASKIKPFSNCPFFISLFYGEIGQGVQVIINSCHLNFFMVTRQHRKQLEKYFGGWFFLIILRSIFILITCSHNCNTNFGNAGGFSEYLSLPLFQVWYSKEHIFHCKRVPHLCHIYNHGHTEQT